MTYDEIYGMDLDNYCYAHNITVESLIAKEKTDIDILNHRLKEEYPRGALTMSELANAIHKLIKKKQKHVERLVDWKADSEFKAKLALE